MESPLKPTSFAGMTRSARGSRRLRSSDMMTGLSRPPPQMTQAFGARRKPRRSARNARRGGIHQRPRTISSVEAGQWRKREGIAVERLGNGHFKIRMLGELHEDVGFNKPRAARPPSRSIASPMCRSHQSFNNALPGPVSKATGSACAPTPCDVGHAANVHKCGGPLRKSCGQGLMIDRNQRRALAASPYVGLAQIKGHTAACGLRQRQPSAPSCSVKSQVWPVNDCLPWNPMISRAAGCAAAEFSDSISVPLRDQTLRFNQ